MLKKFNPLESFWPIADINAQRFIELGQPMGIAKGAPVLQTTPPKTQSTHLSSKKTPQIPTFH
jgi:hypothetical protein